ncbi:hypothetical protein CLV63_1185 [Murinocardiopsis flavida]|uniref:Lipoprotein n=1 Tax=Murinocardiopsis flavida TaxID=645275 RepID=A0A2P8D4X9_9ACTN|nr:hypothetical protein CLV63_1185 [Murinocardiopsis flavida]
MAAVTAGVVMWAAQGCVQELQGGPEGPSTTAPSSDPGEDPGSPGGSASPSRAPSGEPDGPGGSGGGDGGSDGNGGGNGSGQGGGKGGDSGAGSGGGGRVDGDPDTEIDVPGSEPGKPADLVAVIEKAVLTRATANFDATASLNGMRRAEASGGYAFRSEERVDFAVDLDMRARGGGDYSARAVAEDSAFYLKPPTTEDMPKGKSWVRRSRADFEDPPEPRALYAEVIRAVSGIRDWSMIAGASDLVPAGPRTVEGVRGRGYRAEFPVVEGMGHVSGKGGAWRVLQDLYAQGVRDIAFTVWVDDDYLPVAVLVQMDTDEGPGHVDLRFSDWGDDITLPVPAKRDVWRRS